MLSIQKVILSGDQIHSVVLLNIMTLSIWNNAYIWKKYGNQTLSSVHSKVNLNQWIAISWCHSKIKQSIGVEHLWYFGSKNLTNFKPPFWCLQQIWNLNDNYIFYKCNNKNSNSFTQDHKLLLIQGLNTWKNSWTRFYLPYLMIKCIRFIIMNIHFKLTINICIV